MYIAVFAACSGAASVHSADISKVQYMLSNLLEHTVLHVNICIINLMNIFKHVFVSLT